MTLKKLKLSRLHQSATKNLVIRYFIIFEGLAFFVISSFSEKTILGGILKFACTVPGAGEGFFRDRSLNFEQLHITPLLLPRPRNWLIIRFAS